MILRINVRNDTCHMSFVVHCALKLEFLIDFHFMHAIDKNFEIN